MNYYCLKKIQFQNEASNNGSIMIMIGENDRVSRDIFTEKNGLNIIVKCIPTCEFKFYRLVLPKFMLDHEYMGYFSG